MEKLTWKDLPEDEKRDFALNIADDTIYDVEKQLTARQLCLFCLVDCGPRDRVCLEDNEFKHPVYICGTCKLKISFYKEHLAIVQKSQE